MGRFDIDDLDDNVGKLLDSAKLFREERKRIEFMIRDVETSFKMIWEKIRNPFLPQLKTREFDISIFRKCTEVVSTAPSAEYAVLKILQDLFISIYLDNYWDPALLTKLLILYYKEWIDCYRFVAKRRASIGEMLQLVGVASQSNSITKLMKLFDGYIWDTANDIEGKIKQRIEKERPKLLDESSI